jgi:cytochrome bd-type quinol oxidase subunit 1
MEHDGEAARELTAERPRPSLPAVLLFVPLSLLGGFFPAFSLSANLYVLVLGIMLMIGGFAARAQRRSEGADLPSGVLWWLLPVGLFAVVEGITFVMGRSPARIHDYPTLSLLADPLLDNYVSRSLAYFCWLTIFWRLVRR